MCAVHSKSCWPSQQFCAAFQTMFLQVNVSHTVVILSLSWLLPFSCTTYSHSRWFLFPTTVNVAVLGNVCNDWSRLQNVSPSASALQATIFRWLKGLVFPIFPRLILCQTLCQYSSSVPPDAKGLREKTRTSFQVSFSMLTMTYTSYLNGSCAQSGSTVCVPVLW